MTTIAEARGTNRLKPVFLVEITLGNSGPTLYLSDRNLTVAGQRYEDYLGDLSGLAEEVRRAESGGLNSDITLSFRNDRFQGYDYLIEMGETYPFEGAACVIKEVCLDDADNTSETETLFKGVLEEARDIDLIGFRCKVSSMLMKADKQWRQQTIDTASWPEAQEDVGKVVPVVYGSPLLVPALRLDWGARSTLQADISAGDSSLELSDGDRFPASNFDLWIDDEKIHVATRAGDSCTGLTRGYGGTAATAHGAGADAWEHRDQYDSLLANEELYGVGKIYAEIRGRLWRVTSGVSEVLEGGMHKLRATQRIGVQALKDDISIADTITVQDTIGVNDNIAVNDAIAVNDTIGVSQGSHSHGTEKQTLDYSVTSFPQILSINNACTGSLTQSFASFSGTRNKVIWKISVSMDINAAGGGYPPDRMEVHAGVGSYQKKSFHPSSSDTGFEIQFTVNSGDSGINSDTCYVTVVCDSSYGQFFNSVLQVNSAERLIYTVPDASPASGVAKTGAAVKSGTVTKSGGAYKSGTVTKSGTVQRQGSIVGTHLVDRFHAAVSGSKDPDGNYGGAGSLIERPDYVIKHFLVKRLGFSLSDVDAASFDAAGASYASAIAGGYKFAFVIDRAITPSEFLGRLAFECRSTLKYERGRWLLDFLPEAAPPALKTVFRGDLAGRGAKFTFHATPWLDIANDLTARFKRDYAPLGSDSEWLGTSKISDGPSQAKYGSYPAEFEFEAVREQAMADHVLGHLLKQRKVALLVAEFTVFYEHFDLRAGDTVEIENPLFGGRRFYIETINRLDRFRASVRAVEWW